MAVVTNTFQSTSAKGNREELSSVINRITPEDTPIYSLVEKISFDTTHPEWLVDDLAAPAANIQQEGDDYTFGATSPATRYGTYTQIMRKEGIVSGSQDANPDRRRDQQGPRAASGVQPLEQGRCHQVRFSHRAALDPRGMEQPDRR